ncbi:hypothetical protein [Pseudomonas amygdali]|uniref:Uncharacterized protein n=1 Tax=Pseudomonas amygdali pv. lachrymans str. M301315 TaxID=629260 RepID=A0AAD0PVE2_PSEAV|nr:hypothetical protein [Pseudomonas amygdali]AXH59532.1 hypothetical protein PLA107_030360 [Pseudomonas amygdali pv. lachrymans str. M301315]
MKPIDQTKNLDDGQRGNCLAACLASILELGLDQVPEFEELPPGEWKVELPKWAASIGVAITRRQAGEFNPGEHYVAVGHSPRGNLHATVALGGEVVHCPAPTKCGIRAINYIFTVTRLSASVEAA